MVRNVWLIEDFTSAIGREPAVKFCSNGDVITSNFGDGQNTGPQ